MSRESILLYRQLPPAQRERLLQEHEVIEVYGRDAAGREAFLAALPKVAGLIGSGLKIEPAMLDQAPHLKVISSVSVGVDHYPLAAMHERDIVLCHTPDVLTDSVADLVFGMVLATSRRLVEMAQLVRDGQWRRSLESDQYGWDVHGKTLGILGYGRIGQALARRAALGFGMPVIYHSRHPVGSGLPSSAKVSGGSLGDVLERSDFVVVMVPLTAQTRGMLGAEAFARMKPGAILINAARGPIVQESALLEALDSGHLRAAGLDVFDIEPLPLDSRLRDHPRILALPHMGSATHETRTAMADMAVSNLLSVLRGDPALATYPTA
ncbi:MAG TPA: D-glycerate dehydrogenase [Castellaniella sp.]|uniref:2-hydroxyacid dehydrogenase n=1 Tax=Castellaniella sp. TaxID=1955812 RepID=UPI002EF723F6